jgi:hypothetical protein
MQIDLSAPSRATGHAAASAGIAPASGNAGFHASLARAQATRAAFATPLQTGQTQPRHHHHHDAAPQQDNQSGTSGYTAPSPVINAARGIGAYRAAITSG